MKVVKKAFGTTKDGEKASTYTMRNEHGMEVTVSDYGADIISIKVPDKNKNLVDVVLGYDKVSQYEVNAPGFGSFIGRHANRIGDAKCTIDGKVYELEKNDGKNNLHSASRSFNKYMYETEIYEEQEETGIEFSRLSPDMEQGFPGNLDYSVTYTLTNDNELVLEYYGVSNKDTIINFTNHSYFNLSGHKSGTAVHQEVMIDADAFTLTDKGLIPTGELADVTDTPMDFRTRKPIEQDIAADYEPLKIAGGYDHNYVLKTTGSEDAEKVAELYAKDTGILMEVFTDLPGMQFYTGNFIGNEKGKEGAAYKKRDGVCFETQYFPNACNIESFRSPIVRAGEEFESVTIYRFSIEK